jgi:hypothetical protein
MHLIATAVLFATTVYSALRAIHWYEVAPVRHQQYPYARALGWGLACIVSVALLHPAWEVFGR